MPMVLSLSAPSDTSFHTPNTNALQDLNPAKQ